MERITRLIALSLLFLGLERHALAHEASPSRPHLPPAILALSWIVVIFAASLLIGSLVFQSVQKAAAKKQGQIYRGRPLKPLLFGLLVCAALTLGVQRYAGRTEMEHDELRGAPDDAELALSQKLTPLPADQQKSLLLQYVKDDSPGLRYAAVEALGSVPGKDSADAVEAAFLDPVYTVREQALRTLPKLDQERGLSLLLAAFHDEDSNIRSDAALVANTHGIFADPKTSRRMVGTLAAATFDKSPDVLANATRLLSKTVGKKWIVSPLASPDERLEIGRKWRDWWSLNQSKWKALPVANTELRLPVPVQTAPGFTVTDWDGKLFSMKEQRGRITLINFWGTWCGPCLQEIPDLIRLDAEYRTKGLDIVGLAVGEPDGIRGLHQWCAEHNITYRQALGTSHIQDVFGHLEGVPVSILIGADGKILRQWEGPRDYGTFRAAVERAMTAPEFPAAHR